MFKRLVSNPYFRKGVLFSVLILFLVVPRYTDWTFETEKTTSPYIQWTVVIFRSAFILGLPFAILNVVGFLIYCTSLDKNISPQNSPLLAPLICFRVVTRGTFPELVQRNVEHNRELCAATGLSKFMFEVVTDRPLYLRKSKFIHELVVPYYYQTAHGSMYKARALHFCNEPEVNQLEPDDWIVHLDEETLLTEESLIGILNFVTEGRADLGQGPILYASGQVVNWLTTLIDSVRVGIDYCYLRFALDVLRRPVYNWKGSYVVVRAGVEHDISFDHGPEASVTEDCFFGAIASMKGYKFGFIEGEMLEQSTYSFGDFIRQRRRWNQGINLAVCSSKISIRHKIGLVMISLSVICLPLMSLTFFVSVFMSVPKLALTQLLMEFIQGVYAFLFFFGTYHSLARRNCSEVRRLALSLLSVLLIPVAGVLESIASVWSTTCKHNIEFHIVKKDVHRGLTSVKELGRWV